MHIFLSSEKKSCDSWTHEKYFGVLWVLLVVPRRAVGSEEAEG